MPLQRLEPCALKDACTVLRGLGAGNRVWLPTGASPSIAGWVFPGDGPCPAENPLPTPFPGASLGGSGRELGTTERSPAHRHKGSSHEPQRRVRVPSDQATRERIRRLVRGGRMIPRVGSSRSARHRRPTTAGVREPVPPWERRRSALRDGDCTRYIGRGSICPDRDSTGQTMSDQTESHFLFFVRFLAALSGDRDAQRMGQSLCRCKAVCSRSQCTA